MVETKPAVLIVDDVRNWRDLFSSLLQDEYNVTTATSYAEAIEALRVREPPFDVVIADLRLEEAKVTNEDGLLLLQEIKDFGLPTKAIVVTGYPSVDTVIKSLRGFRAFEYLEKYSAGGEFDLDQFLQIVRAAAEEAKKERFQPSAEVAEVTKRALVIEDEPEWQHKLRNLLTEDGYTVYSVSDYDEAIGVIRSQRYYDVVILDLTLGDPSAANGMVLLEEIANSGKRSRVVVVTASDSVDMVRSAFREYGVSDCLRKNAFDKQAFRQAVRGSPQERLMTRLQKEHERRLAAEAWATLGKAAGNLMHRINNTTGLIPFAVQSLKELLGDAPIGDGRQGDIIADLDRIERNSKYTLQLAKALWKPFEDLPATRHDVNNLLEEAISVADIPTNVHLERQFDGDLPTIVTSHLLTDVFVELITNAIKAMPDGGRLRVVSEKARDDYVEVRFSDTGRGISLEDQDKIFDLFFTTDKSSLGFGLWWVKTFLTSQGGTISIKSRKGRGTTFAIRLPIEGPRALAE
jgi:CheY-like chemotaxis protein